MSQSASAPLAQTANPIMSCLEIDMQIRQRNRNDSGPRPAEAASLSSNVLCHMGAHWPGVEAASGDGWIYIYS